MYLWELKGDLKNMSYSTKRITLYLDRPNISYYSAREPMVEYLGTRMAYADPDKGADADIINIYGKQSSSGGTVKVGPQLNRDDHVAYIMGYPDGTVQPKGEITRAEACTIFFRLLTDSSRDYCERGRLVHIGIVVGLYRCERGRLVQQRHLHALQRRYRHGL